MKDNKQIEPVPDAVKRRIAKTLAPVREHVARVSPIALAETRLKPRGYRVPVVDEPSPQIRLKPLTKREATLLLWEDDDEFPPDWSHLEDDDEVDIG